MRRSGHCEPHFSDIAVMRMGHPRSMAADLAFRGGSVLIPARWEAMNRSAEGLG
jgi:hypothetical protein